MGFSGRLNTAFIERVNLSVRQGVALLARGPRRSPPHAFWLIWNGGGLPIILCAPMQRYGWRSCSRESAVASWQRTEALAAGRTNRRWTTREVLCSPLPPVPCFKLCAWIKQENSPRKGRGWLGED